MSFWDYMRLRWEESVVALLFLFTTAGFAVAFYLLRKLVNRLWDEHRKAKVFVSAVDPLPAMKARLKVLEEQEAKGVRVMISEDMSVADLLRGQIKAIEEERNK